MLKNFGNVSNTLLNFETNLLIEGQQKEEHPREQMPPVEMEGTAKKKVTF